MTRVVVSGLSLEERQLLSGLTVVLWVAMSDVVEIHRGAMRKVRDADRMKEQGRIDVSLLSSPSLLLYTKLY